MINLLLENEDDLQTALKDRNLIKVNQQIIDKTLNSKIKRNCWKCDPSYTNLCLLICYKIQKYWPNAIQDAVYLVQILKKALINEWWKRLKLSNQNSKIKNLDKIKFWSFQ